MFAFIYSFGTGCLHSFIYLAQGVCIHLFVWHRVFAFTRLNAHSSRSHAIVMLTIIKRHRTAPGQEEGPIQKVKIGKLFMVDLAGSERLKKSLSTGTHLYSAA